MKKTIKAFAILFFIGTFAWFFAIFLRNQIKIDNPIKFLLNILPNFGSALIAPSIFVILYSIIKRNRLKKEHFLLFIGLLFFCILLSEIIFALFFKSSFDIYDIFASIISLIICISVFNMTNTVT